MTPSEAPHHMRMPWTTDDVQKQIQENKIIIFAKGTRERPRCGFSEMVMNAIERSGKPYEIVDVYSDRSIIPALNAYSGRQYVPLVYVDGQLISSSDTIEKMVVSGELQTKVEKAFS